MKGRRCVRLDRLRGIVLDRLFVETGCDKTQGVGDRYCEPVTSAPDS